MTRIHHCVIKRKKSFSLKKTKLIRFTFSLFRFNMIIINNHYLYFFPHHLFIDLYFQKNFSTSSYLVGNYNILKKEKGWKEK